MLGRWTVLLPQMHAGKVHIEAAPSLGTWYLLLFCCLRIGKREFWTGVFIYLTVVCYTSLHGAGSRETGHQSQSEKETDARKEAARKKRERNVMGNCRKVE